MTNYRLMIAGTGSSCGKTTVTCGILGAMLVHRQKCSSFKCGPDFIDPMFHREVVGVNSSNIDLFLHGEKGVLNIIGEKGKGNISIIEGVMGFYDGLGGVSSAYSSCHISLFTKTPVILVLDCKGKSLSLAVEVNGYLKFSENNIKGVILNNLNPNMYEKYKQMLEKHTGLKVYGFLPKIAEFDIKSRHLGLVTAAEIENIKEKLNILCDVALKYIDISALIKLSETAPDLAYDKYNFSKLGFCKIAVAKDKAFCFYYEENLEILQNLGAEIIYFSPLEDECLPKDADAVILGGGYPELYLKELSQNESMRSSIKKSYLKNIPIWAECGGFIYLFDKMEYDGVALPLCGVFEGKSYMTNRLQRFGYITLTAQTDTLFLNKGSKINAHEFHYSDTTNNGEVCIAEKSDFSKKWECIHSGKNIFAGYPHLHFYGNPSCAENFIKAAISYRAFKRAFDL